MLIDLEQQIAVVLTEHPGLAYDAQANSFTGSLEVYENDYYEVTIDISPFPDRFPLVYETGERIPVKADRHVYTDSGSCCFTTVAKAQILLKTRIKSLPDFIRNIAIPYFQNNSYYEINGKYLQGEHSHGHFGVIEGYQEILGIKNVWVIAATLEERIRGRKIRIKDKCYCGSGKPLKKCEKHQHNYKSFRLIDKAILIKDLAGICDLLELYVIYQKMRLMYDFSQFQAAFLSSFKDLPYN